MLGDGVKKKERSKKKKTQRVTRLLMKGGCVPVGRAEGGRTVPGRDDGRARHLVGVWNCGVLPWA